MNRIYHLNCGFLHPVFPNLFGVTYVLLVETNQGWLLVDSGFGTNDFSQPDLITKVFAWFMRIPKNSLPVIKQLPSFKIDSHSVNHIVFTHLHLDHAGGLADFPWATAHVFQKELNSAQKRQGVLGFGYQFHQWKNHKLWQVYEKPDSVWLGLPSVTLTGITPVIKLIPIAGHTPGHCMVAIENGDGWILQSGSACFPFQFDRFSKFNSLVKTLLRPFWGNNYQKLTTVLKQTDIPIDVLTGHDLDIWKKHQR